MGFFVWAVHIEFSKLVTRITIFLYTYIFIVSQSQVSYSKVLVNSFLMHCALKGLQCPAWIVRLVNLDLLKNILHIRHPLVGLDHPGHRSIRSIYKFVFLKLLFQKLFFILILYMIWSALHSKCCWFILEATLDSCNSGNREGYPPWNRQFSTGKLMLGRWHLLFGKTYFQGGLVSLRGCNKIPFIKNWIDLINPLWTGGFATRNISGITWVVPSSQQ